jgi:hypothetical protein
MIAPENGGYNFANMFRETFFLVIRVIPNSERFRG